jgi:hypothetical protein
MKALGRRVAENAIGIAEVTRSPRTDKSAKVMLAMWGVAGLLAAGSLTMSVIWGDYGPMFYVNCGVLTLDVYMLRLAILGIAHRTKKRGDRDA